MGNVASQRHANSSSMTKKMFSQMGTNIIQGEGAGSGSKATSHSGMGNLQQKSG